MSNSVGLTWSRFIGNATNAHYKKTAIGLPIAVSCNKNSDLSFS